MIQKGSPFIHIFRGDTDKSQPGPEICISPHMNISPSYLRKYFNVIYMKIENKKEFRYQISINLRHFGKVHHHPAFTGIENPAIKTVARVDFIVFYGQVY
jgi:hypothetical protein